ncbi:MAG: prevent-host-death family protein [Chthoniobacteraceae bacterium]|nr:prevent-host-death family protein [Chthoniobacteraceae bacterium]
MANTAPHTFGFASIADLAEVTASVLKNKFSEVARLAANGPLAVSRHRRREFVILTAEQYEELQQSRRAPIESLTAEFDQIVARMNTPEGKRATAALFSATSADLGRTAVKNPRPVAHA